MVLTCDLSMLVRYCLYAHTLLPLCSYAIASMLVQYCLHDRTIWPEYCPLILSSHSHRRYWSVTCPCSYGIASMTIQYVPANIAQRISGTYISERCAIVSNRYNISATKTVYLFKNICENKATLLTQSGGNPMILTKFLNMILYFWRLQLWQLNLQSTGAP